MPPANPTSATAARINDDYLGLLYQVIDLEVISLGHSQWHSIRGFRRDSPTDRPDAGNSNDGTRQDIRQNGTATHYCHRFLPCPNAFSSAGRSHKIRLVKSLGSLQRLYRAHQT
jgi:hypothetical protein